MHKQHVKNCQVKQQGIIKKMLETSWPLTNLCCANVYKKTLVFV